MKNRISNYKGVYQQEAAKKKRHFRFAFFYGVVILSAVIISILSLKSEVIEEKNNYILPEEVPVISLPETMEDKGDSRILGDLVVSYFNFTMEAGDHLIDISLPLIKASFGSDFNTAVGEQLENLVSNTIYQLEHNSCIYKSVGYEAYLDQEILTILLHYEYNDGQSQYQPWIYDLSKGGVQITDVSDLTKRLLEMDYASFLWVTDRYIQDVFKHTYFDDVYAVPESEMNNEHYELPDTYSDIMAEIPQDISNKYSRWIFPADGKVYLAFQLPIISNDWYDGFQSETLVVEIDENVLKYEDMISTENAILDIILNTTVHPMGATDQTHAMLTRNIFYSSPEKFISAVKSIPETEQTYMIDSLFRYTDEVDCTKILKICENLKSKKDLPDSESVIIKSIITKINGEE